MDVFNNFIRRFQERISQWDGEKVLLHGAGEHSRGVLERIQWGSVDFLGFVDKSEKRQAQGFLGYPVFSPDQIIKSGATKIVISSFSFQEDIYCDLQVMGLSGVEVVKLYTEEDFLAFIKERYALCPKEDIVRPGFLKNINTYLLPPKNGGSPKVLLIHPPFGIANRRHKKILPMNLLYLASFALKKNPKVMVRILDAQIHDISLSEIKKIITLESWDIIGMGYWTGQASVAFEISQFVRRETKALLVHGGVHPTVCPEEAVKYCDVAVIHEGEETFSEIVELFPDLKKIREIPGVAYQNQGKEMVLNSPRTPMKDLDNIPFPAYHLMPDITIYDSPMHVTGGLRVPLIGSRGCPYTCTFCVSPLVWNRRVRWRSPIKIVDEMEMVIRSYGVSQFHFWDDNIMMKREYVREISEEIIRRDLTVHWCGLTRSSHVIKNKDVLPIMKESGCVGIEIGIESFTEDSTYLVEKGEDVKAMMEASQCMEEAGISPLYTHMFFNPGETITGYRSKQEFIDKINKKNTAFIADSRLGQASTPHRKTRFEAEAPKLGDVFLGDSSTYIHHRINFIPHSLLEDAPLKNGKERKSPMKFLEIILQAIFDWDETMIDQYMVASDKLWKKIDGKKTVRALCEEIRKEMGLDEYRSKVFVCLSVVGLAREGRIQSNNSR